MSEFKMPSLGAEMEEGTLVEWKFKPGEEFKKGDVVAEVETDKGAIDVEIWESGVFDKFVVEPGEKVPVGAVLAITRTPGEPASKTKRAMASPAAKKRASELGVDLDRLKGSGKNGAITLKDVEETSSKASQRPETKIEDKIKPRKTGRGVISAAMSRSKREIPHYYLSSEINMDSALKLLGKENQKRPVAKRILYPALLLKATALALKKVPELNGFWKERFEALSQINIGFAISLKDAGLVAPALKIVDTKSVAQIMEDLQDLVARARRGSLKSSELSDATVTVTNLGEKSAQSVFGIIHPPQVAIVGFGEVTERPVVLEGEIVSASMLTVTISGDHRASDGHRGAIFLNTLREYIENPDHLMETKHGDQKYEGHNGGAKDNAGVGASGAYH